VTRIAHTVDFGWRRRPLFAYLKLRPTSAQHTATEAGALKEHAAGARCVVEIGVAEGASAYEIRSVMDLRGELHLIDPYHLSGPGNFTERVARRTVNSIPNGTVRWYRAFSHEVVRTWSKVIDVLFLDGDHEYEGVRRDFDQWHPFLAPDGQVVLHDARGDEAGPGRLRGELTASGDWDLVAQAEALAVLRRTGASDGGRRPSTSV
jgi:hypothetical protein